MQAAFSRMVERAIKAASGWRYHRSHAAAASKILRSIESRNGRTNPAHLRLADAYAREVLGHAHFAPWLYVYTAFTGTFKEGWIPDNYYGSVVVPTMKGEYGRISNLKALTSTLFRSERFPDTACYVNGLFLTPQGHPIPAQEVQSLLFQQSDRVVFKADHSIQGKGIFFFDAPTFSPEAVRPLGNGVFQRYILQHPVLEDFAPRSVATLRITTVIDDRGDISVRACYLRLGRSADTHVQSKSHIRVPVNPTSGELFREGYLTDWLPVQTHPDSGLKFAGARIPVFSDCLAAVISTHQTVRFARCVGWDVAIDRDEQVKLMEWNGEHNDIKFSEATQGPCFQDLGWEKLAR